ncbi:MAG: TatD family hydrolase [Deltaproteobacteria bacterium]|nr:TatD family hydrolase [Deltaproteobacteria bacterium]
MLTDSHSHLDMGDFDQDREKVILGAMENGITRIITVGIDLKSSRKALDLAKKYPTVFATVGCHPHDADRCSGEILKRLADLSSAREVVAWGEIGLDFYKGYSARENQVEIFEQQVAMARELHMPVIIHDREAHEQVLSVLKRGGKRERQGVIHCFSGDLDLARSFIDLGYYISIPGTVTYKKALMMKEVAASIPLERLLVETDAPFLAPVPQRGKRNEPAFVRHTVKEIARLRDTTFEEVAVQTTKNAVDLFGLS